MCVYVVVFLCMCLGIAHLPISLPPSLFLSLLVCFGRLVILPSVASQRQPVPLYRVHYLPPPSPFCPWMLVASTMSRHWLLMEVWASSCILHVAALLLVFVRSQVRCWLCFLGAGYSLLTIYMVSKEGRQVGRRLAYSYKHPAPPVPHSALHIFYFFLVARSNSLLPSKTNFFPASVPDKTSSSTLCVWPGVLASCSMPPPEGTGTIFNPLSPRHMLYT